MGVRRTTPADCAGAFAPLGPLSPPTRLSGKNACGFHVQIRFLGREAPLYPQAVAFEKHSLRESAACPILVRTATLKTVTTTGAAQVGGNETQA